ncbi:MAG: heparinase II/III family protein, partial [Pyrinomonadaceae bacterium]
MSIDELGVRTWQFLSALAERNGWSGLTKVPTAETLLAILHPKSAGVRPETLLKRFQALREPRFFAGFTDSESTIQELRSRWPEAESEIVRRANAIVDGKFDLLGFRDLSFGNPIDWHLEPISGKRAPSIHWSRLNFLDAELAGDKKIVWELNRHHYFATLGQAYWLTGDENYAQTFVTHINSWMDQNPPKVGIN